PADLEHISKGELRVTVNEDGKTRIKDRYLVSSPLSGQLLRVELEPGDSVTAMKTVVAQLQPDAPNNLDARTLAQAEAKFKMSELTLQKASLTEQTAQKAMLNAEKHLARTQKLRSIKSATEEELENAELDDSRRREEYNASKLAVDIARFEMEWARLAMWQVKPPTGKEDSAQANPDAKQNYEIFAPISGKVLRKLKESATPITAGTAIVEVGDPQRLEMEIDVLSSDAVQIPPQAKVIVKEWGGEQPLHGIVRVVEPAAFTKVSALGVEEQRVYVIVDLIDPPEKRATLGDAYRIEAEIILWENDNVLKVPTSALFRKGSQWSVFKVVDGRARQQSVEIGHRNGLEAEVLKGLSDQDTVIVHPSDRIADGVQVSVRTETK
ncbi:MAG: yknX 2, partial [Planctomycetaceae bacterium]|nr:yknX 2 [Planctomycetaceae bacterium]